MNNFVMYKEGVNNNLAFRELFYFNAFQSESDEDSRDYDHTLINFLKKQDNPHLFYVQNVSRPKSKVRSYKGVLSKMQNFNFEYDVSDNYSFIGFILPLSESNVEIVLKFFFAPNNCCVISTPLNYDVNNLKNEIIKLNFWKSTDHFWINYLSLLNFLPKGSKVFHHLVRSKQEILYGVKEQYLIE